MVYFSAQFRCKNTIPSLLLQFLAFQLSPQLLIKVILYIVIVPVVLPNVHLVLVFLIASPIYKKSDQDSSLLFSGC